MKQFPELLFHSTSFLLFKDKERHSKRAGSVGRVVLFLPLLCPVFICSTSSLFLIWINFLIVPRLVLFIDFTVLDAENNSSVLKFKTVQKGIL